MLANSTSLSPPPDPSAPIERTALSAAPPTSPTSPTRPSNSSSTASPRIEPPDTETPATTPASSPPRARTSISAFPFLARATRLEQYGHDDWSEAEQEAQVEDIVERIDTIAKRRQVDYSLTFRQTADVERRRLVITCITRRPLDLKSVFEEALQGEPTDVLIDIKTGRYADSVAPTLASAALSPATSTPGNGPATPGPSSQPLPMDGSRDYPYAPTPPPGARIAFLGIEGSGTLGAYACREGKVFAVTASHVAGRPGTRARQPAYDSPELLESAIAKQRIRSGTSDVSSLRNVKNLAGLGFEPDGAAERTATSITASADDLDCAVALLLQSLRVGEVDAADLSEPKPDCFGSVRSSADAPADSGRISSLIASGVVRGQRRPWPAPVDAAAIEVERNGCDPQLKYAVYGQPTLRFDLSFEICRGASLFYVGAASGVIAGTLGYNVQRVTSNDGSRYDFDACVMLVHPSAPGTLPHLIAAGDSGSVVRIVVDGIHGRWAVQFALLKGRLEVDDGEDATGGIIDGALAKPVAGSEDTVHEVPKERIVVDLSERVNETDERTREAAVGMLTLLADIRVHDPFFASLTFTS